MDFFKTDVLKKKIARVFRCFLLPENQIVIAADSPTQSQTVR